MGKHAPSRFDICARCGEPCEADDLVCARCSETRIRAALPAEGLPPSVEEVSLDELLSRAERGSGEHAHHIVAAIEGALGGEVTVSISVVLTPDGPATPAEEIWSNPTPLTTLACGSSEVAAARMSWIERVTTDRGLAAADVSRRYRVGTRGYRGEPQAVGMLLDARLHMARRALEEADEASPIECTVRDDEGTLRVEAEFKHKGAIELFSMKTPTTALRSAVAAWTEAHAGHSGPE
jgi:hypothetical protein